MIFWSKQPNKTLSDSSAPLAGLRGGEQGENLSEPSEHSAGLFAPVSEAETERRRADESSFRNGQGREHSSLPWSGHGMAGRSHESAHRSLPVREARAQGPEVEGKSRKRASAIRPRPRAASSAQSLRRRTNREEQGQCPVFSLSHSGSDNFLFKITLYLHIASWFRPFR